MNHPNVFLRPSLMMPHNGFFLTLKIKERSYKNQGATDIFVASGPCIVNGLTTLLLHNFEDNLKVFTPHATFTWPMLIIICDSSHGLL